MNNIQYNILSQKWIDAGIYLMARIEPTSLNVITLNSIYAQWLVKVSVSGDNKSANISILRSLGNTSQEYSMSLPIIVKYDGWFYLAFMYTRLFQGCISEIISMSDKNNMDGIEIISQKNIVLQDADVEEIIYPRINSDNWQHLLSLSEDRKIKGISIPKASLNTSFLIEVKTIGCSSDKNLPVQPTCITRFFLNNIKQRVTNVVQQEFSGILQYNKNIPNVFEDSTNFYLEVPSFLHCEILTRVQSIADASISFVSTIPTSTSVETKKSELPISNYLYPCQKNGLQSGQHVISIKCDSFQSGKVQIIVTEPNDNIFNELELFLSCMKNAVKLKTPHSRYDGFTVLNNGMYVYVVFDLSQTSNNIIIQKFEDFQIEFDKVTYDEIKNYNHRLVSVEKKSYGIKDERPNSVDIGSTYYDTTLNAMLFWNGRVWTPIYFSKGSTSNRPELSTTDEGFEYYDTTLKKKILWNGTDWVNMDGTELEVSTSNEQVAENPS